MTTNAVYEDANDDYDHHQLMTPAIMQGPTMISILPNIPLN